MKSHSHHKKGNTYINPFSEKNRRGLGNWIGFCLGLYNDPQPKPTVPVNFQYPQAQEQVLDYLPKVTWINHSTFLVEIDGIRLLTDPIWSDRCSPISFMGPKRKHPPGKMLHELPKIDYVFISHNHYDHLDKPTVLALYKKNPQIVWNIPKGMKKWFERLKIHNTLEYDWWDIQYREKNKMVITAVPAQHFSGRNLLNFNKTPWNGYVIEFQNMNKKLYFAGDTGYNNVHFNEIGQTFKHIDLSLIPIGAYTPKKFMQPVHASPQEAVNIHREVHSKLSIGSHHSTFNLSKEIHNQPAFDLYCAMEEAELDHNTFRVLKPGQTANW